MNKNFAIVLFYKYSKIKKEDCVKYQEIILNFCKKNDILGRIILSTEGINGTASGANTKISLFKKKIIEIFNFSELNFKTEFSNEHAFKKIFVRIKKELVHLGLKKDVNPLKNTGIYLNPQKWLENIQKENSIIIDARNNYEYAVGHFQNAINPNINHFRDIVSWTEKNIKKIKNKKIYTYCTGGIRCEKFSGFLKTQGCKEVYQLEGGIINYCQKQTQKNHWLGSLYVFDKRIVSKINKKTTQVIGKDFFDNTPCERYINCYNPECNKQILVSEKNEKKYKGSCSLQCRLHKKNLWHKQ